MQKSRKYQKASIWKIVMIQMSYRSRLLPLKITQSRHMSLLELTGSEIFKNERLMSPSMWEKWQQKRRSHKRKRTSTRHWGIY